MEQDLVTFARTQQKGLAQGMGTEPGGRNRQWCNTVRLTKTRAGQFCLADSEGTASQVS